MHFFFHQDANRNVGSDIPNLGIGLPLKINEQKISRVNQLNFLGILLTSKLSWKQHTYGICSKISKNAGMLWHLRNLVPSPTLKIIYNSLIHSYLGYGILAWGFNPGRTIILQKKAIRAITNSNSNAHAEPLFKNMKILAVNEIFFQRGLKFYYLLKNDEVPRYFSNMFTSRIEVHGHFTRGAQAIHVNPTRTVGVGPPTAFAPLSLIASKRLTTKL